jgi:hypothetical protein
MPVQAPPVGAPRRPATEEELDELPPLDGDDDEPDLVAPAEIDESPPTAGDPFDDSTGEDAAVDPADLAPLAREASWVDEPPDALDLALGDTGLTDFEEGRSAADDCDEPAIAADDIAFGETLDRVSLDAGDEGPLGADDELREEDLPAFDADEEGEPDEAGFWDEKALVEASASLPWAMHPWSGVGAPLPVVRARALVCVRRGALVAAQMDPPSPAGGLRRRGTTGSRATELARVDLEGAVDVVDTSSVDDLDGAEIDAVAAAADRVALVLSDGRLFVSAGVSPRFERRAEGVVAADVLSLGETMWVRTRAGGLVVSTDNALSFARCAAPGRVVAIAPDGTERIAALVVGDAEGAIAVLRGARDGTVIREPVDAPPPARSGSSPAFAAKGKLVAYATPTGVVRRGADGVWRSSSWGGRVTAAAFVDAEGTLLVATYSDADDATSLVRLDVAGEASVVARVGATPDHSDGDGLALAMACDDSRGVVWLAGGFGVAAFAIGAQGLAAE